MSKYGFYLLLLVLPTLLIAGSVVYLLRDEQERLERRVLGETAFKAETLCRQMQNTILTVQEDLLEAIAAIPEPVQPTLEREHRSNPLVRNVFIWEPGRGLRYPLPHAPSTREEQYFIKRYENLFNGRYPWENRDENEDRATSKAGESRSLKKRSKLNLAALQLEATGGWKTWFWEDKLYLLCWYRDKNSGQVRGIELEMMTLFANMLPALSVTAGEEHAYALLDGQGEIFHLFGDSAPVSGTRPDLMVPVGPALPHWQVAVFFGTAGDGSGVRSFQMVASLLVVLLTAAILMSGWVLIRQAQRHMLEARQKTNFVSNVSHELKTPLTSIRMFAELLSQGRVKDPEKRKHHLGVIVAESERLSRLVQNVLEFSRLEQGQRNLNESRTRLDTLIGDMVETHGLRIRNAGSSLVIQLPTEPVVSLIDRDALEQILLNLLDNAVKYGKPTKGGVTPEITVSMETDRARHQISVCDNGPGIPIKLREKVFENFFRVDQSLAANQTGAGIGLSLARGLCRQIGGDLRYRSRRGGGSCFVIELPVQTPSSQGGIHDGN